MGGGVRGNWSGAPLKGGIPGPEGKKLKTILIGKRLVPVVAEHEVHILAKWGFQRQHSKQQTNRETTIDTEFDLCGIFFFSLQ